MSQGPGTISASFAYEPPAQNEWDTASTKKAKAHNPKKERAKIFSHLKRGVVLKIVSGCLNVWLILKKIVTAPDKIANTTASSVNAATLYTHSSFGLTPTHSPSARALSTDREIRLSESVISRPSLRKASLIASRIFLEGFRSLRSKSLIVDMLTPEMSAKSPCWRLNNSRADLHIFQFIIGSVYAALTIIATIKSYFKFDKDAILSYLEYEQTKRPLKCYQHKRGLTKTKHEGPAMANNQLSDSTEERKTQLLNAIEISKQNTYMKSGKALAEEERRLASLRDDLADLKPSLFVSGVEWKSTATGYKSGALAITPLNKCLLSGPDVLEYHDTVEAAAVAAGRIQNLMQEAA